MAQSWDVEASTCHKPTASKNGDKQGEIFWGESTGSRYAVLGEDMEIITEGEEQDESGNHDTRSRADSTAATSKQGGKGKGKATLSKDRKEREDITLNVSHISLTESLRTGGGRGSGRTHQGWA